MWSGWIWREQQLRDIGSLPGAVAEEGRRPAERDLRQRAGASWRGGAYLRRPGLNLRLVNLPGYSPDFNAADAIWGWARESLPS